MTHSRAPFLYSIVKGGAVGTVLDGVGGATLAREEGISLMNEGRLHLMASERAFDQLLGSRQRAALSKSDQDRLFAIQVFADGLADRVEQTCRY